MPPSFPFKGDPEPRSDWLLTPPANLFQLFVGQLNMAAPRGPQITSPTSALSFQTSTDSTVIIYWPVSFQPGLANNSTHSH